MFMAPLPESRVPLPGAMLQKPRLGTMFRLTRSASGIGEIFTSADCRICEHRRLGQ